MIVRFKDAEAGPNGGIGAPHFPENREDTFVSSCCDDYFYDLSARPWLILVEPNENYRLNRRFVCSRRHCCGEGIAAGVF